MVTENALQLGNANFYYINEILPKGQYLPIYPNKIEIVLFTKKRKKIDLRAVFSKIIVAKYYGVTMVHFSTVGIEFNLINQLM